MLPDHRTPLRGFRCSLLKNYQQKDYAAVSEIVENDQYFGLFFDKKSNPKINVMKKIMLLSILTFFFISCEKEDYLIPAKDIPDWVKADIKNHEQKIKDSPQLMYSYGAWLRYKWQNDYYFEYHNSCSSTSPKAYSYDGNTRIEVWDKTTDYYKEKCCKVYVWKAPEAIDY